MQSKVDVRHLLQRLSNGENYTVARKSMARVKLQKLLSANGENFQSGLLELYGVFSFYESLVLNPHKFDEKNISFMQISSLVGEEVYLDVSESR